MVPSAGSTDWNALFREYQETMEKGKLLATSETTTKKFEHHTSAKGANEFQADALQQGSRKDLKCDHFQATENKIYSIERDPHGISAEFQTSAVLREMRDRYEEVTQLPWV